MVSNRRIIDAEGPEFYPTPEWGTLALLKYVKFDGRILEPCCGDGAMARVLLSAGCSVDASDITYRGYGKVCDFLNIKARYANVVTNPPFNVAATLLDHALLIAEKKVCFLLRTAFLESQTRYRLFYENRPPSEVLVFSERLSMYPKGHEAEVGGTTSYSWFVWDQTRADSDTKITWIAPGLKPERARTSRRSVYNKTQPKTGASFFEDE